MQWERIAPMIGAVGGLVFILINAGELPGPVSLVIRGVGVAAFVFVLWFAVLRRRPDRAPLEPPSPRAMRIYWISVAAEAAAIPIGATVIAAALGLPQLTVCWVILVVGVHFLPFATAFELPIFTHMGWTLVALAVVGGALTLAVSDLAAPATAILAGVVLLFFSALGAAQRDRMTVDQTSASDE
jgi:hypothetical protein